MTLQLMKRQFVVAPYSNSLHFPLGDPPVECGPVNPQSTSRSVTPSSGKELFE